MGEVAERSEVGEGELPTEHSAPCAVYRRSERREERIAVCGIGAMRKRHTPRRLVPPREARFFLLSCEWQLSFAAKSAALCVRTFFDTFAHLSAYKHCFRRVF